MIDVPVCGRLAYPRRPPCLLNARRLLIAVALHFLFFCQLYQVINAGKSCCHRLPPQRRRAHMKTFTHHLYCTRHITINTTQLRLLLRLLQHTPPSLPPPPDQHTTTTTTPSAPPPPTTTTPNRWTCTAKIRSWPASALPRSGTWLHRTSPGTS